MHGVRRGVLPGDPDARKRRHQVGLHHVVNVVPSRHILRDSRHRNVQHCVHCVRHWDIPGERNARQRRYRISLRKYLHCDGLRSGPADLGLHDFSGPRLLALLRWYVPAVATVGLHDAGLHAAVRDLRCGGRVLQRSRHEHR